MDLFNKALIKFDVKENKEYIYSSYKYGFVKDMFSDDIGRTFLDFLANSDEIIKIMEEEISTYYRKEKLKDTKRVNTCIKLKLRKISPFFNYFDYDEYLEKYIENLRKENYNEINSCLEQISEIEEEIRFLVSREGFDDLMKDEMSEHHDYDSSESIEAFEYIEKSEKEVKRIIEKYKNKYNREPSYYIVKKLYDKNKDYVIGDSIFKEIENKINENYNVQMKNSVEREIKRRIISKKKFLKNYKSRIKEYVKDNEKTIGELFDQHINTIKFWLNFSKYILISYYNLDSSISNKNCNSNQRLLDYILHINRTYYTLNLFEVPESNVTLELSNESKKIDIRQIISNNEYKPISEEFISQLNNYKISMIQEYSISKIEDFICISLMNILEKNINICKCENCGKLFIPINKSNEKYCTYKFIKNKSCRELSYNLYLQKNEISNILRKKYRTENAKKNRNIHIPNINKKFDDWYERAKKQKELCEKNKITVEQFRIWLEENTKWF